VAIERFQVQPRSIFRQQAAVVHFLKEKTEGDGHIWIETKALLTEVKRAIQCDCSEGLRRAVEKQAVVEDSGQLALWRMAKDEKFIADRVLELMTCN